MKPVGASFGRPGMVGKPIACLVGSTSVPRQVSDRRWRGGSTPFITQSRKCTRRALTVSRCGSGLAGKRSLPIAIARAGRGRSGVDVETAAAAAMLRACDVIAAHIGGQRHVLVGRRADEGRRQFQAPHFGRAEMFDDFRAGVARGAAVENAGCGQSAHRDRADGSPGLRAFAAGLDRASTRRPAWRSGNSGRCVLPAMIGQAPS